MKKYVFLEDVALADIAYEAYGKNLGEMFRNAAKAIFELSADVKTISAKKKLQVKMKNKSIERLLYDFLSEILFLKDSQYVVFMDLKVKINENKKNKDFELSAVLSGDTINSEKQHLENDIKAITMHMFEVKKEKSFWKARVVVDL